MIKIAHRGNIDGPAPGAENSPAQLELAISRGFDVEVDVWVIDSKIFLGHDLPQHPVSYNYLIKIANKAWFHCKNVEALELFSTGLRGLRYFWHQEDRYTITSHGQVWVYPGEKATVGSVVVDLDLSNLENYASVAHAVCTDYPSKLR